MSPWPVMVVLGVSCAAGPGVPLLVEATGRLPVGRQPEQVAVADLDGDGDRDLVAVTAGDKALVVLLGDGRGGFRPAPGSPFSTGRGPYRLAVADFDRDGRLDVATPNVGGSSVTVFRGGGDGSLSLAAGSPIAVDPRPFFAGAGDVQGDGWPDLVLSHDGREELTLLLGGKSGFSREASSKVRVDARAGEVVLADLDGDGRADFVTGTASHQVVVLLGDERGGFRSAAGSPFATGRGPWSLAVADLTGDGRLDVVTANSESEDLSLLFGQ